MDKVSMNRQDTKILAKQSSAEYVAPEDMEQPGAQSRFSVADWPALTYLTLVSRLALGGIFLIAGLTKLGDIHGFALSIDSYQISMGLPVQVIVNIENAMATVLPPLEIALGIWLLVGLFTRWAAAITGGLVVIFLLAMIQAMLRGFGDLIDCGCFATGANANPVGVTILKALGPVGDFLAHEKADAVTIARDLVFLLMSVHLMFVPTIFGLDNLRNRGQGSGVRDQEYDEPQEDVG